MQRIRAGGLLHLCSRENIHAEIDIDAPSVIKVARFFGSHHTPPNLTKDDRSRPRCNARTPPEPCGFVATAHHFVSQLPRSLVHVTSLRESLDPQVLLSLPHHRVRLLNDVQRNPSDDMRAYPVGHHLTVSAGGTDGCGVLVADEDPALPERGTSELETDPVTGNVLVVVVGGGDQAGGDAGGVS